jgi:hypothetical protein
MHAAHRTSFSPGEAWLSQCAHRLGASALSSFFTAFFTASTVRTTSPAGSRLAATHDWHRATPAGFFLWLLEY